MYVHVCKFLYHYWLQDDASTVVLKSDSEVVTVITKQARSNEITEVKPSIIKSTCAGPERQVSIYYIQTSNWICQLPPHFLNK